MGNSFNKKFRAILMDVDGTLVSQNNILSDKTKEVLQRINDTGISLCLVTGRPLFTLLRSVENWNLNFSFDVLAASNGAEIYHKGKKQILSDYLIDCETIRDIIGKMKTYACYCYVYGENGEISPVEDPVLSEISINNHMVFTVVDDVSSLWDEEKFKVMVRFFHKDETERASHNIKRFKDTTAIKTHDYLMEFIQKDNSKDKALDYICELYRCSTKEIIACGDSQNDLKMLKKAGLGICMINGEAKIKKAADLITERGVDEDGLALCLEKLFEGEEKWVNM